MRIDGTGADAPIARLLEADQRLEETWRCPFTAPPVDLDGVGDWLAPSWPLDTKSGSPAVCVSDAAVADDMAVEQVRRAATRRPARARLDLLREDERRRLARELHDEFGQALTGLKLDLAWLGRQLQTVAPELAAETAAIAARVDATVDAVRRITAELRPAALDDLGLLAALQWQAAEFQRRTGIPCDLELPHDDDEADVGDPTATAVFRVFQEALTNVTRHADANRVVASLARDGDRLVLRVADDGDGIAPGTARRVGALGLTGMRERATALGGDVTIRRAPHGGTVVTLTVPDPRVAVAAVDG